MYLSDWLTDDELRQITPATLDYWWAVAYERMCADGDRCDVFVAIMGFGVAGLVLGLLWIASLVLG